MGAECRMIVTGVLSVILAVLLAACASTGGESTSASRMPEERIPAPPAPRPPAAKPAPRPPPKAAAAAAGAAFAPALIERHAWAPLTEEPARDWTGPNFGLYTYVLFNGTLRETPAPGYEDQRALNRLKILLAIVGLPESAVGLVGAQARATTNLFLIPANTDVPKKAEIEMYDAGLSGRYLDYFRAALAQNKPLHARLTRGRGPFLLATLHPVAKIVSANAGGSGYTVDRSQPILLVDLTGAHYKSVIEVVQAFKDYVADAPLAATNAFEPMRVKLVSLLLGLNDAIPIVRNAVAGTCQMFGVKDACPRR